jgi:hypothetical protein
MEFYPAALTLPLTALNPSENHFEDAMRSELREELLINTSMCRLGYAVFDSSVRY